MDHRPTDIPDLYSRVGPQIWGYLRRRLSDREVADELLQETFLIATEQEQRLRAAQSSRAWLFGIARNLLREHVRRVFRNRTQPLAEDTAEKQPGPGSDDPRIDDIRAEIQRLPDTQKEVLELRLEKDMSYAEIAEALEIPIGTVRSRLHNAILRLKERVMHPQISAGADG